MKGGLVRAHPGHHSDISGEGKECHLDVELLSSRRVEFLVTGDQLLAGAQETPGLLLWAHGVPPVPDGLVEVLIGPRMTGQAGLQGGQPDLSAAAQVLSHLGSGAEIGLATLQTGLAGHPGPDQDFNQSVWDRWNAMSPQEKARGFLRAGEQLVTGYEKLDAAARQELHVKMAFLPFPADIAVMSGMRPNEATLHGWDVRVALDPHATLNTQEVEVALEQLTGPLNFMVGFLGKPEALSGTQATLRVETTDPARFLTLVLGPTISLSDQPADSDDVLSAPAEALLRLLGGRLDQGHTPQTLTITSDVVT